MAIAKVLEVNSSSSKSFEDAIQTGIAKVTETIKNVQGAWINEQKVVINDNKITEYRVNLKISFLVEQFISFIKNPHLEWGFFDLI